MKKSEENITLELSPKQYEELMKWAYAGQSVYYMYHHPGRKKIDEVDDFFQYLLSQGKGLKKLVQDMGDGYDLTDKNMAEISEKMMDFLDAAMNEIEQEQMNIFMSEKKKGKGPSFDV